MKHSIESLKLVVLAGALTLASCGNNSNTVESTTDTLASKVENGMDKLGDKVDTMMNKKSADEEFLSDAVEANTMELKALMMGQQKGGKDVKMHAGHMITDHKKLGADVKDYIAKKNIKIDEVDTTKMDNDLGDKTGMDFDKAWADKMVSDHEKVIKMFEDAQNDVKDADLKNMITAALPKLKSHLEMSKQLQDKLNKTNSK